MKECIITDNPEVTILLATYNPNREWLIKQLKSLNSQDYPNIKLIALDDCSPDFKLEELIEFLTKHITAFPFKALRNEKNLGSTKTFEKLTMLADTPLIAYCDQDDIWEPFKISESVRDITAKKSILSCCDVSVIDGNDNQTAESVTELWKRQKYYEGENLADKLLFRNFVIGCTVVMDTKTAQAAAPFPKNMVHDHWLALFSALNGKISVCDKKLMKYRIHGENQTGTLSKINSKNDYYNKRIIPFLKNMKEIFERLPSFEAAKTAYLWAESRERYYSRDFSQIKILLKYKNLNRSVTAFEILMKFMPSFVFRFIIKKIQSGEI
ncbi:MAG TPA: glycosyltransferase [Oscillospiraceae bacterium]|nr:glycosyltransferase [Oscillospiraceae bacterium]